MKLLLFIPFLVFLALCIGGHYYTRKPPPPPLQFRHWDMPRSNVDFEVWRNQQEIAEARNFFKERRDPFRGER